MNDLFARKPSPGGVNAARWWETLFHSSEEAQMVCRKDGVVQQINRKAATQFQLQPAIHEGNVSIFKILSPPANRKLGRMLQLRLARPGKLHSVLLLQDGSPHAMMDLEVASLDGEYSLLTFQDSGHRLRLESHVQRLVTAIDATPDVFFVADASLRITFANPAFQSSTGYSLEEALGRPDDFLRAPSEQPKVAEYRRLMGEGREWTGELVNVRRDGSTYEVESTISPISDFAGHFMGYVVSERDITVRKQLQDELRTERDFVQSILQSLDGAIYSLDCDLCITHANDGWRRLAGEHGGICLEGGPEIGRPLLDYVPDPVRREELQALFLEVLESSKARENNFHSSDGRHWQVKISPWIIGAQMRGLICSVADQTKHHELLNHVFQAQKMEILGTLSAGVAHDFNNLLQVIRGHTSLVLMKSTEDSPLRRGLEKVDMAAARAAKITQQLLSFGRVSEERRIVMDLNKVVRDASQMGRQTLRSNVLVEVNPASQPIHVKMDPTKASQALLNLYVNAQDAMPEGGRLTVTNSVVKPLEDQLARHQLPPGGAYARCTVADTGCGIPPDALVRIFEPFYTTKEEGKGTGLGLAIVQRVAVEAGGFVEVESVLKQGTTFHLYLPVVEEAVTPVTATEPAPLAHGKGRVLVVDDQELLRDFTKKFLQATGLQVLVASDGPQALKILEQTTEPVDLLFTDYNMPGMNGVELVEQVAKRWPATKFVLASGFLKDNAYARMEPYNVSIIAKPYDMADASEIVIEKLAEKAGLHVPAAAVKKN